MIKTYINNLLRDQLRKPSGLFANKIAKRMNQSNGKLCLETIDFLEAKGGDKLLEIGFGNGNFMKDIFTKYPDVKVTGIDYSIQMVNQAKKRNIDFIESCQLDIIHGNSNALPFEDNSFDKIFCVNVIYFWDHPKEHLDEILRVLKPGGTFYSVIRDKASMDDMKIFDKGFTLYSPENWQQVLEGNRFININVKRFEDQEFEFDSSPHILKNYCISGSKKDS